MTASVKAALLALWELCDIRDDDEEEGGYDRRRFCGLMSRWMMCSSNNAWRAFARRREVLRWVFLMPMCSLPMCLLRWRMELSERVFLSAVYSVLSISHHWHACAHLFSLDCMPTPVVCMCSGLTCKVISQVSAIAVLHHQIDMGGKFQVVIELHYVSVPQLLCMCEGGERQRFKKVNWRNAWYYCVFCAPRGTDKRYIVTLNLPQISLTPSLPITFLGPFLTSLCAGSEV